VIARRRKALWILYRERGLFFFDEIVSAKPRLEKEVVAKSSGWGGKTSTRHLHRRGRGSQNLIFPGLSPSDQVLGNWRPETVSRGTTRVGDLAVRCPFVSACRGPRSIFVRGNVGHRLSTRSGNGRGYPKAVSGQLVARKSGAILRFAVLFEGIHGHLEFLETCGWICEHSSFYRKKRAGKRSRWGPLSSPSPNTS